MRFLAPDLRFVIAGLVAGLLLGCAPNTAVSHGHNTALDSVDLFSMTDKMAMNIAGSDAVQSAIRQKGKLVIVVQPVENRLTGEILPEGQAEMFTARVRSLLSKHAPDQYTWVMNRDAFYRLRGRELDVDLGPAPDRLQPEYALTARFSSMADEDANRRVASYLCAYSLTSLRDGTILWTGKYEVEKRAVKGFLD